MRRPAKKLKAAAKLRQQFQQDESRRQIERLRVAFEAERSEHEALHERSLREAAERFNEQIQEKNRTLEKVNRERSDIIGLISHDLRAPLAGAVELTSDLVENAHDTDNVIDSGQALLTVQRQMLDLTQSLLDIDALESGSLQTRSDQVHLPLYFEGLIAEHRTEISRKSLTIIPPNTEATPSWTGPKMLLERAVENLFSNAIKYSPTGQRIAITLGSDPTELTIKISDTGPGIPPDKRSRMFEKFATLGSAPTGGESAHGLGLYLARRCAEHANGTIHYEDTPGGGATFVLTLPQG